MKPKKKKDQTDHACTEYGSYTFYDDVCYLNKCSNDLLGKSWTQIVGESEREKGVEERTSSIFVNKDNGCL